MTSCFAFSPLPFFLGGGLCAASMLFAPLALGCAQGGRRLAPETDGGPGATDMGSSADAPDARRMDDSSLDSSLQFDGGFDARLDMSSLDTGRDLADAGYDRGPDRSDDAGPDASFDAGFDAGSDVGPPPLIYDPATETLIASAAAGYTRGTDGLALSDRIWGGWPFEVPAGETWRLRGAGFHDIGGEGTYFGAIIAFEDPSAPIDTALDEAVVGPTQGHLEGMRGDVRVDLNGMLAPGRYAVIFGTGSFGSAAVGSGPAHGLEGTPGAARTFSVVRSSGARFELRSGFRMFVVIGE